MSWWRARSERERRLLLAAGALALLVLAWFALIRPLANARASAETRLRAAATELARARADAASLKQAAGVAVANPAPAPLAGFLIQSAGEQGFTNLAATGDRPERATVNIPQVRPAAFFGWIGQLETRGVTVVTLNARANADQTIAVRAELEAGGR